jgi:flagellar biosynthesis protein
MSVDTRKLAVALHYDKSGAPRVVAKGKGSIGEKIVELARAHDIPPDLYKAVAEVLVFVLRLSGRVR